MSTNNHYCSFEITNKGFDLRQTAIAGGDSENRTNSHGKYKIDFTRGSIGQGRPEPDTDIYYMTELVSHAADVPIKESYAKNKNHIMVIVIDGMALAEDVTMTEIGIFARLIDTDTGVEVIPESLYGYTYTNKFDYIPAGEAYNLYREIAFNTVLSRKGQFEIVYDKTKVYATHKEVEDMISSLAAKKVRYDNSESGLDNDNMQGAIDNLKKLHDETMKNIEYEPIPDEIPDGGNEAQDRFNGIGFLDALFNRITGVIKSITGKAKWWQKPTMNIEEIKTQLNKKENLIMDAAAKTTLADADALPIIDSTASNATKKVTWSNIKNTLKSFIYGLYHGYVTCSTASGTTAKTVTLSGFALESGVSVKVKFTNTNTASSPTLNVNSTGAKSIFYKGAAIPADLLAANVIYEFVYDGTQFNLVGTVDIYTKAETDTQLNNKVSGKWTHYSSLDELKIVKGSETIEKIVSAMEDKSSIRLFVNTPSGNADIYPYYAGVLNIEKVVEDSALRVIIEFTEFNTTPGVANNKWLGFYSTLSGIHKFTGWKHIACTDDLAKIEDNGIWTPRLQGGTVAGTNVYATQIGKWHKVGNLMWVFGYIKLSTKDASMSGGLQIQGLPVAPKEYSAGEVAIVSGTTITTHSSLGLYLMPDTTFISVYAIGLNASYATLAPSQIGDTFEIRFSAVYPI